jgi:RHS repeat-associated protein
MAGSGQPSKYTFTGHYDFMAFGLIDMQARMYSPLLGRFVSADTIVPGAGNPQAWNRYTFVFNNPLGYVDASGHIPYPITIRSFAPFDYFGFGYNGDNRGYSTSANVTSKAEQKINFDTDTTSISAPASYPGKTYHVSNPDDKREGQTSWAVIHPLKVTSSGDIRAFTFGAWYGGSNPFVPPGVASQIDVFSAFKIVENKSARTLEITTLLKGDNFPSTEAFISDPSGQNVFIGIGFYDDGGLGKDWGPGFRLPAPNRRSISNMTLTINLGDDGNFKSVTYGKRTLTIAEWNSRFTNSDAHDRESFRGH